MAIQIVAQTVVDWPVLRRLASEMVGLCPSNQIKQYPVEFSPEAETVLFPAMLKYEQVTNVLDLMRCLPRECMDFLHYTILISCSPIVLEDIREQTRIHLVTQDIGRAYCVLGTGPLSVWFDAIVLLLTEQTPILKTEVATKQVFTDILMELRKRGLSAIFDKYTITQHNNYCLLEHK